MTQRVPNAPLRAAYEQAVQRGVRPSDLCRAIGMIHSGGSNFRRTPKANVDHLLRCLGIRPSRSGRGEWTTLRTMRQDRAEALLTAIESLSRGICACGESKAVDAAQCGFCSMQALELVA